MPGKFSALFRKLIARSHIDNLATNLQDAVSAQQKWKHVIRYGHNNTRCEVNNGSYTPNQVCPGSSHKNRVDLSCLRAPQCCVQKGVYKPTRVVHIHYSLRPIESVVFYFYTCLTIRLLQIFYANNKINKSLLKYL